MSDSMPNMSYLFQVSQQPYRWKLLCSLYGWGTQGSSEISKILRVLEPRRCRASHQVLLTGSKVCPYCLVSSCFLWADLRFECRGQDASSCWVRVSLLFENKTFSLSQRRTTKSPKSQHLMVCFLENARTMAGIMQRHFSNQLCFGVFRAIKRPVRNHKTSCFLHS